MRGDEQRVIDAFCAWLEAEGWTVHREVNSVDIFAKRADQRLYAEAKGRTSSIGLDVDTLYGQLLRRMDAQEFGAAIFGIVVPQELRKAVLRVPAHIRQILGIHIFLVDAQGAVEPLSE